jgi:hypothetical protein
MDHFVKEHGWLPLAAEPIQLTEYFINNDVQLRVRKVDK